MPKTKLQSWRGGVNPSVAALERTGVAPSRSYPATIVRRSEDGRARLRVSPAARIQVGDKLIVESDFEAFGVDVYAAHHANNLVDVRGYEPLVTKATRVSVRRVI